MIKINLRPLFSPKPPSTALKQLLIRLTALLSIAFLGMAGLFLFFHNHAANTLKKQRETALAYEMEQQKAVAGAKLKENSNHIQSASEYAYPTEKVRQWSSGKDKEVPKKLVFLTFDDGPNTAVTPRVLEVLKQKKVPATFFIVGRKLEDPKAAALLSEQLSQGHAIAVHSYSHNYKKLYPGGAADPAVLAAEVDQAEKTIRTVVGESYRANVFRYPGGRMSWKNTLASDEILRARNTQWIDWNGSIGDASGKKYTSSDLIQNVKQTVAHTSTPQCLVLLMHDEESKLQTVQALPEIIDYLRGQGYSFGILE